MENVAKIFLKMEIGEQHICIENSIPLEKYVYDDLTACDIPINVTVFFRKTSNDISQMISNMLS